MYQNMLVGDVISELLMARSRLASPRRAFAIVTEAACFELSQSPLTNLIAGTYDSKRELAKGDS